MFLIQDLFKDEFKTTDSKFYFEGIFDVVEHVEGTNFKAYEIDSKIIYKFSANESAETNTELKLE